MAGAFPDLVAPIVPDAQHNQAAQILLEGMKTGLAAVANFNNQRRESELEIQKMALTEKLQTDQHAFEREKLYKDNEVQDEMMRSHAQMFDAYSDLAKAKAKSYADGTATAAQRAIAFNQQRQDLVTDVNDQATKLQLDDPNFATKEPVKYAANVMQFKDMFELSPLPEVKNAITQYQRIADQQKITLKQAVRDEGGNVSATGPGRQVPIWQVVQRLQNPDTHDAAVDELKASGHIQTKDEKVKRPYSGMWDWLTKPSETTVTKEVPDATTSKIMGDTATPFEHVKSRVPPAMLPKSAAGGTAPTALPQPDIPVDTTGADYPPESSAQPASSATPDYQPTETDGFLSMAKAAIGRGAPMNAVAAKLQELGIDPKQLFAT